ncbi:MAG: protein-L-isoaspartate(D-aspartate) O-methyltransferase [Sedimenticola sp.]|nr:protein-L-isoaspartate(D-aspartate) O-methyltransferase [Sedimenticola sp.]
MKRMLADIDSEAGYTRTLTGRAAFDRRVMEAMAQVPRDEFVPDELKSSAYDNGPLPIGFGQTISQPYIVALMTDLLDPQPDHRLLEVGTGSGYQAAVLSLLCDSVYSVDRVAALTRTARTRLQRLGYDNVHLCSGNGYLGWPEHAPYDGIIVTAAAPYVPEALVAQLKPGGRLVIPVGERFGFQQLQLLTKEPSGDIRQRDILGVAFVPLIDGEPEHSDGG